MYVYMHGISNKLSMFKEFEVGCNGACKGHVHSPSPFIGCKALAKGGKEYKGVCFLLWNSW